MISLRRYFTDSSGHDLIPMFSNYLISGSFYTILTLSGITVLTWPWKGFVTFMQTQRVPFTFLVVIITLLCIQTYLHTRIGRGEIALNYYFTREKIHQQYLPTEIQKPFFQYGLPRAGFQIAIMLLPFLPVLLLVTVVSGFSLITLAKALSVIYTASLIGHVWGFLLYELWGNSSVLGYFVLRLFLAATIYLAAFLEAPISPLRILYQLGTDSEISRSFFFGPYFLYILGTLGCIVLLSLLCEWRGRYRRHAAGIAAVKK